MRFLCAAIDALLPHEEQNGTAKEQYSVDDRLSEDMQRADHRGHSEDKQNVEQVGTDGDNAIASHFIFLHCFLAIKELK